MEHENSIEWNQGKSYKGMEVSVSPLIPVLEMLPLHGCDLISNISKEISCDITMFFKASKVSSLEKKKAQQTLMLPTEQFGLNS